MFCNKCGKQLQENAKFCNCCGGVQAAPPLGCPIPAQTLHGQSPPLQTPPYMSPSSVGGVSAVYPVPRKGNKKKLIVISVIVAAVLVRVILGTMLLGIFGGIVGIGSNGAVKIVADKNSPTGYAYDMTLEKYEKILKANMKEFGLNPSELEWEAQGYQRDKGGEMFFASLDLGVKSAVTLVCLPNSGRIYKLDIISELNYYNLISGGEAAKEDAMQLFVLALKGVLTKDSETLAAIVSELFTENNGMYNGSLLNMTVSATPYNSIFSTCLAQEKS